MKKTILIFVFILSSLASLNAQISFSCTYRQYCEWNDSAEKFDNCEGYAESSLFVMNEDETMFTHTIETMKSTYYISSKEYKADTEVWTYDVISDVGNSYIYIFDPKNKEIRVLFIYEGKAMLLGFTVKSIF